MSKAKLKSIDKLTDEIVGKKGTQPRENFEYELEMDVLSTLIKNARKKTKSNARRIRQEIRNREISNF